MKFSDVDRVVLREVVRELSERGDFRTKDVSGHPKMVGSHHAFVLESHYHDVVGRVIGRESVALTLRRGGRNVRGMLWIVV